MIDSNTPLTDRLVGLLLGSEPLASRVICQRLGISQPTLSRAVADLGDRVCRMGAARSTRYALTKDILGWPSRQPIVLTDTEGSFETWGELIYLYPNGTLAKTKGGEWLNAAGCLPWFLMPLRPQGFLGRQYARVRPDFPPNPDDWSLAQTLHIITQATHNSTGAFELGQKGGGRWVDQVNVVVADRLTQYDITAVNVSQTLPLGSSAGGEQPKFLSEYSDAQGWQHCIVKFTPLQGTPFGARWRALLSLEQLALQTLAAHGIATAATHLLHSTQRTYLESVRFDRIGFVGKQHIVAIAAVHDEFVGGSWTDWVETSKSLAKKGLITHHELLQVATIFAFGHYIGNTDMHSGNVSFFVDDVITPKIRLAPVYDMLPMMWRPDIHQGVLPDSPVRPQRMPAGFAAEQAQARLWAIDFWERAAQLNIGADLQMASLESARRLKTNFVDI